jgi:hypothetical protein
VFRFASRKVLVASVCLSVDSSRGKVAVPVLLTIAEGGFVFGTKQTSAATGPAVLFAVGAVAIQARLAGLARVFVSRVFVSGCP